MRFPSRKNSCVTIALLLLSTTTLALTFPSPAPNPSDEDATQELLHQREQLQQGYQQINRLNPMAPLDPNLQGVPRGLGPPSSSNPGEATPFDQVEKILANPVIRGYLRMTSNPIITAEAEQIMKHPNRQALMISEGACLLFFLLFRAWRSSKLSDASWFRRWWMKLWTLVAFVAIFWGAIPIFFLGQSYYRMLLEIYRLVVT